MTYGAVIVAAGMSSRMGSFKATLQIGTLSMIGHIISSFRQAGVDKITVVTGHNAAALKEHLSGFDVTFLHNPEYQTTQMFDSVKIGLSHLKNRCDRIFFTPVDVPLFTPGTLRKLMDTNASLVTPCCAGKQGHPLLLSSTLADAILSDCGENGLKGAIARTGISMTHITVDDPGVLHDADTPEQFQTLLDLYQTRCRAYPSDAEIAQLLSQRGTPEAVRAHCSAVAEAAAVLAAQTGLPHEPGLLRAACLLHDITRTDGKDHAHAGAEIVRKAGYPAVAEIIGQHHDLTPTPSVEAQLLYLADKLVQGIQTVSIRERFAASRAKCITSDALSLWEMRYQDTIKIVNQLKLGFLLEQNGEST